MMREVSHVWTPLLYGMTRNHLNVLSRTEFSLQKGWGGV